MRHPLAVPDLRSRVGSEWPDIAENEPQARYFREIDPATTMALVQKECDVKIYVATSWKNTRQPGVVKALRDAGHDVYDFREPKPETSGFQWSDIDPDWKDWPPAKYRDALTHPLAKLGFDRDFNAMQWADAFVLVMPCGASAHLEAGWAIGQGKPTCILIGDKQQAELMYKMASSIVLNKAELLEWLKEVGGA